jgi:hypothetical protein
MDALTTEYITHIAHEVHPDSVLDATSVAYIQHLLTPYGQAVEQAESVDSIYAWLDVAYGGELAKHAKSMGMKAADKVTGDETEKIKTVRKEVIEYLVAEITELAGDAARNVTDGNILPWDIKVAIVNDEDLERMLKQGDGTNTMPVTVRIGANDSPHSLTEDFVAGILLYYTAAGHLITLYLYGVPLTSDYLTNDAGGRHEEYVAREGRTPSKYLVKVGTEDRSFNTPDFLQGAATAALWLNEDFHTRLTNLRTFTGEDDDEVPLTF